MVRTAIYLFKFYERLPYYPSQPLVCNPRHTNTDVLLWLALFSIDASVAVFQRAQINIAP